MYVEIQKIEDKWLAHISGKFSERHIVHLLTEINRLEKEYESATERLMILSPDMDLDLDHKEYFRAAGSRNVQDIPEGTRTAFVLEKEVHFGFARMWTTFIVNDRVDVKAFKDITTALEWLGWTTEVYKILKNREISHVIPESP